jgi:hypothetical protein
MSEVNEALISSRLETRVEAFVSMVLCVEFGVWRMDGGFEPGWWEGLA